MKIIFLFLIVITATRVAAQQTPASRSTNKLLFEKTYIHTDRDWYTPGDTLWFKSYLVDAANNKLSSTSSNLHVELISPQNKIISSRLLKLDNGVGNGEFDLADSLLPGNYRLRAYTSWMRNFGDNFLFTKEIEIIKDQTADAPSITSGKTPDISNPKTLTENDLKGSEIIRFYPEGGSLVNGISSFVGVKAENNSGNGIPAAGAVLTATGDTISHFACDSSGLGYLILLPIKGQVYHATYNKHDYYLPAALDNGPVMHIQQTDSILRIGITVNEIDNGTALPLAYKLMMRHAGEVLINQALQLSAQQSIVSISLAGLPPGVSAITLYDEKNKPNCERLVYIHNSPITGAKMVANRKSYKLGDTVTIQLTSEKPADLSLVAINEDISSLPQLDISSYLLLSSEIRGNIENPVQYFDTTNKDRFKKLDNLLLTQGWRDFVWRRLADTALRLSYPVEKGIPISGTIKDEISEKPLPNLNISLYATAARGVKLFNGESDSTGYFVIPRVVIYGKEHINLTALNVKGKNDGIFSLDSVWNPPAIPMLKSAFFPLPIVKKTDGEIIVPVKIDFNKASKLKEVKINSHHNMVLRDGSTITTFGYPDQIFNIKPEDREYNTLEWFLTQKGNGVNLSAKNPRLFVDGYELNMRDSVQAQTYRDIYYTMPIWKFKSIVFKHMIGTFHGFTPSNVGSEETRLKDFYLLYLSLKDDAMTDNPGRLDTEISGYDEARIFYQSPVNTKATETNNMATIFWAPNIKTDQNGKATISFINNSAKGNVLIYVQGITQTGGLISLAGKYIAD